MIRAVIYSIGHMSFAIRADCQHVFYCDRNRYDPVYEKRWENDMLKDHIKPCVACQKGRHDAKLPYVVVV